MLIRFLWLRTSGGVCPFAENEFFVSAMGHHSYIEIGGTNVRHYSDPTANAAIGAIEKELKARKAYVKKLNLLYRQGLLSDEYLKCISRQFTGIFAYLYEEIFRV